MKKISTLIIAGFFAVPSIGFAMTPSDSLSQAEVDNLKALMASGQRTAKYLQESCILSYAPYRPGEVNKENPPNGKLVKDPSFYVPLIPRRAPSEDPFSRSQNK